MWEEVKTPDVQKKWSLKDFTKVKPLGKGSYSKVFLAKHSYKEEIYALKEVDKVLMLKEDKLHQLKRERDILFDIDHPNIIKLYFTFSTEDKMQYFGLEYAPNGDLAKLLKICHTLPLPLAQYYAAELVNALEYLKSKKIVHRDIKPENILLDENYHLKVTDFGTAKYMDRPSDEHDRKEQYGTTFVGSPEYVSPEVLRSEESSPGSDLWALGCLIYKFLVGVSPFCRSTSFLTFEAITRSDFTFPSGMHKPAKDICTQLLVLDPAARLGNGPGGYDDLRSHVFFKGIDFSNLYKLKPPIKEEMIEKLLKGSGEAECLGSEDSKSLGIGYRMVKKGKVKMKTGMFCYSDVDLILNANPRLLYFSSKTKEFQGDVMLTSNMEVVKRGKVDFDLVTSKTVYYFKAESSEEASAWVEVINSSIPNTNN
eukprot:TRINITY_DN1646_c0_g1_i14.p1 TRINITY_DN1646_c0_g1~~TRINITY_DN1646_c0_g1_i14.p1  ORF type:complete len:425 (+),score=113.38 TRINITY_DN1646_c0_g1_i14:150-1424(+)